MEINTLGPRGNVKCAGLIMKRNAVVTILIFTLGASCWTADALAMKVGVDDEPTPNITRKPQRDRPVPDDIPTISSQASPGARSPGVGTAKNHDMLAPRFSSNYRLPPVHSPTPERIDSVPPPAVRMDLRPRVGMQWSTEEQKPSLEYRMSDNGVIRLHGAHRGAQVRMQWKF